MKTYVLKAEQAIPVSLDKAWDFFSSPLNLARITPPEMNFVVTSNYNGDAKMYPGMIITYVITPLFGIKMNWMTEITHIKENQYFIDEQRSGPYAIWHHQHHFKTIPGGVLMTDILNYALPFGVLGQLGNKLIVEKRVQSIFAYRTKAIKEMFGEFK